MAFRLEQFAGFGSLARSELRQLLLLLELRLLQFDALLFRCAAGFGGDGVLLFSALALTQQIGVATFRIGALLRLAARTLFGVLAFGDRGQCHLLGLDPVALKALQLGRFACPRFGEPR